MGGGRCVDEDGFDWVIWVLRYVERVPHEWRASLERGIDGLPGRADSVRAGDVVEHCGAAR